MKIKQMKTNNLIKIAMFSLLLLIGNFAMAQPLFQDQLLIQRPENQFQEQTLLSLVHEPERLQILMETSF